MKWSAWAGLAAPFALLILVLATVVILPRVQAAHRVGIHASPAAVTTPTVVNLPAVIVTPNPDQVAAKSTIPGGSSWSVSSVEPARPLGRAWPDLGMPYYSFGKSVLISVKD